MSTTSSEKRNRTEITRQLRPQTFEHRLAMFEALDPNFAHIWSTYTEALFQRPQLSVRDRLLVQTGQHTVLRDHSLLADTIRAAVAEELDLKEVLEVIFQVYVYAGESAVAEATSVFIDVVSEAGLLEDVKARGLAVDATSAGVSLDEEREQWSAADNADSRIDGLIGRLGWLGLSNALRQRPGVLINTIAMLDVVDTTFDASWLEAIYGGMYRRAVLDERTRALCVIGNFLVIHETFQNPRHMRVALRNGVTPRELIELVFHSCAIVGHPHTIGIAIDDVINVVDDEDRLDELVSHDQIDALRELVAMRTAARGTIGKG